jgi:hypothetical protein
MSVTTALLEEVLEAAARGESLIAVGANKKPWYSWKRYQEQAADQAQLLSWSEDRLTAGYAVVTGALSGFVVVDFDEDSGIALVEEHGLDPHVRTGRGGYHLRVEHPGFHVATQNSKVTKLLAANWPGLDIRGDGGYAIEYGRSEHGAYEHLRDLSELEPIGILPEDMAAALGLLGQEALDELAPDSDKAQHSSDGKFHTGHRHRHLLEVAGAMAGRGLGEAEILAELRRVNQRDCVPPKDDDQLVALASDVASRYGEKATPSDRRRADVYRLEELLRLAQNGAHIRSVRLIGRGSGANVEIRLTDGRELEADRFGDLWTHTGLAKFVTQGSGIQASGITKLEAEEANAIIRRLSEQRYTTTEKDLGLQHGADFLDRASVEVVNINDQEQRFHAWSRLNALDPVRLSDPRAGAWREPERTIPPTIADASIVLEHTDGRRLVRCDWLYAHVRQAGQVAHPGVLARRMELAGWTRPNTRGAIKATSSSGVVPPIILKFWVVPVGWEDAE